MKNPSTSEREAAAQQLFAIAIKAAGGSITIPDHLIASFDPNAWSIEAVQEPGGWRYTLRER